jgi:hypothetical protein
MDTPGPPFDETGVALLLIGSGEEVGRPEQWPGAKWIAKVRFQIISMEQLSEQGHRNAGLVVTRYGKQRIRRFAIKQVGLLGAQ